MQNRHTLCHIRYAKYLGIEVFSELKTSVHFGIFHLLSLKVNRNRAVYLIIFSDLYKWPNQNLVTISPAPAG